MDAWVEHASWAGVETGMGIVELRQAEENAQGLPRHSGKLA